MVAPMAIRVEDFDTAPTLAARDGGARSLPEAVPIRQPRDWRLLYEREHARAERERARAEELRWAEVAARCDAGSWKSRFEASRRKLKAAVEEAKEARRAAKDALSPRAEVARLHKLLREAGVDSGGRGTIMSLRKEVARLRRIAKASRSRIETLEAQLAKLHATRAVLSKALFGRKSEKREAPRSGRRRGQQRGAPGHGRTRRPGLEEGAEEHNPPADARVCARCGCAYAAVGAEVSTLVEIEVRAHKRVIRRPRWRRTCDCASSPAEVSSPPAPRLFANTPYGGSVWSRFLYERYACFRPLRRVAAWLSDQGLPVSPGTLADSVPRFVPLFEPVADAILAHQNEAALRHADETSWRVRALRDAGRSSRAWLWTSVSDDAVYFHIDPSRSAEAARKLFAEAMPHTVIVCDRYSAYKKLARLRGGLVTLAWYWAYVAARIMLRRDGIAALDMKILILSAT